MPFTVSPGVITTERDLTNVIPNVASVAAGFAGNFAWGPVLERRLINNEANLVRTFGKPDDTVYKSFFTASNYLQYANALYAVRVVGQEAYNGSTFAGQVKETFDGNASDVAFVTTATFAASPADVEVVVDGTIAVDPTDYTWAYDAGTDLVTVTFEVASTPGTGTDNVEVYVNYHLIKNEDHWDTLTGLQASFYAKYPGLYGNNLKVIAADTTDYAALSTADAAIFTTAPEANEIHVAVLDEDGGITGSAGTVLEKWEFLSTVSGTTGEDGTSIYYKDVVNNQSLYLWSTGTVTDLTNGVASIANGTDGDAPTTGQKETGYDLFLNSEEVDVRCILGGDADGTLGTYLLQSIAEVRKDCFVWLSVEQGDVLNNTGSEHTDSVTFRNTLPSTSYGALDSGYMKQYDRYNDKNRWIPMNGGSAGLYARTENIADAWWSPAGYNRGRYKNVIKLAYNPAKTYRDVLYRSQINPIVTENGEGTLLLGDKTLLTKPSAFDRINVRMLFIVLEKAIATAAKYMLFEQNDEFSRAQFKNMVEPFLREVKGRRGITDFSVICDETNNTDEVLANNEFVADIYINPTKSINYIKLNFIATRGGNVSFQEQVV